MIFLEHIDISCNAMKHSFEYARGNSDGVQAP